MTITFAKRLQLLLPAIDRQFQPLQPVFYACVLCLLQARLAIRPYFVNSKAAQNTSRGLLMPCI